MSTSQRATTCAPASTHCSESLAPFPPTPIEATRILSLAPLTWAVMT
jgi:hypothetical protein